MATKAKPKAKAVKKAVKRSHAPVKSISLKGKAGKFASHNGAHPQTRSSAEPSTKRVQKVETRRPLVVSASSADRPAPPQRVRPKHFPNAVQAYEAGIKLMHAEEFEKAIRCFEELVAEHPEEPEIQERAKVLIHASEKKLQEKARTVLRSADDHYNVGIADLNRREITSAIQHLEHALKLNPKGDHVLYALAAASALQGDRDQSLNYLKQAIQLRPENRFLAVRDADFELLQEDPDFRQLVTPAEK
jgi:tetratricopeptide (TPR) repeat protein